MVSIMRETNIAGRGYLGMASGIKKRAITTVQKITISDVSGIASSLPEISL
jgi:hypothetical protein